MTLPKEFKTRNGLTAVVTDEWEDYYIGRVETGLDLIWNSYTLESTYKPEWDIIGIAVHSLVSLDGINGRVIRVRKDDTGEKIYTVSFESGELYYARECELVLKGEK
jgi:hypothetical protein